MKKDQVIFHLVLIFYGVSYWYIAKKGTDQLISSFFLPSVLR